MAEAGSSSASQGAWPRVVRVTTPMSDIPGTLLALAKRGELPGYGPGRDGVMFETDAHASPFDHRLAARARAEGGGTVLEFRVRMLPRAPWIMGVTLALAAGPGLWLTQSMMETYFEWYRLSLGWTAAWYLGLTLGPIPLMVPGMVRRSRREARAHAEELIGRIVRALGPA